MRLRPRHGKVCAADEEGGQQSDLVKALYYHGLLTLLNLEDLRESHGLMAEAHAIAERLGAGGARAYARYGLLLIRSTMGLDAPEPANECRPR